MSRKNKYKRNNRNQYNQNQAQGITTPYTDSITEQEVYDTLSFAQTIYNSNFGGFYSPHMQNKRMQDITLNPIEATRKGVEEALLNPKENQEKLIGYSEFFELSSMIYKRMIIYMSHLLSFDVENIICINAESKDYTTPAYKKDYQILCDFLDKFDIKKEFTQVMREVMRNDASFYILRDDGNKYTLQELPSDHCKITGRWDYGLLYDFNMNWFLQAGSDINTFPDIFKEMYNIAFLNKQEQSYKPSSNLWNRGGMHQAWVQTSPEDGFVCWKLTPEQATRIPFLSPLFPDIVLQPIIRNLQTNKYIVEASKLVVGLIPMLDTKGGNIKDQIALDINTTKQFLNLIKQGLSDSVKVTAGPFEDMKSIDFKGDARNMLEDYTKTTTAMSGINSRLIYSSDKPNVLETQLSLDVDVMTVSYMYRYFEDILNWWINKFTSKFKFQIKLGGINTTVDRESRMERVNTASAVGVVIYDHWAFALGMLPHHFIKSLEKTKAEGFVDKLIPMMNIFTQSPDGQPQNSSSNNGGAPKKPASKLSDSGMNTRSDGMG